MAFAVLSTHVKVFLSLSTCGLIQTEQVQTNLCNYSQLWLSAIALGVTTEAAHLSGELFVMRSRCPKMLSLLNFNLHSITCW